MELEVVHETRYRYGAPVALSHHLASMLAGPVVKGTEGATEAKRQTQLALGYVAMARASDGNQRNVKPEHITSWISGR